MKKTILLMMVLLNCGIASKACQTIQFSWFQLLNKTENSTDIRAYTNFSCPSPPAPALIGYIEETRLDTLYFRIVYKGYVGSGSGSTQARYDTFTNITLPENINYLNISSNIIRVDGQGQITDTSWNDWDSTFALHPVGINDIQKNVPHIAVYPNPANNTLYFEQGPEYQEAHVYNIIGQRIATYPSNNTKSIDISSLAKGSYFLRLTGKQEENIGWARFVKATY